VTTELRQRPPRRPGVVIGFVAGLAAAGLGFLALKSLTLFSGDTSIDTSRATVVRQIRQLERLETVMFTMDKIVSGGHESSFLPQLLAGDRLLLLVHGDVTSGFDLGRVEEAGVSVNGREVRLRLPPAEIFATRIDNDRTRVYSRETGLFSRVDPQLESELRREAEHQVRQAALDAGILKTATENGKLTLTSFLGGLGFEKIEIAIANNSVIPQGP
jgi:hypothetical protein